MKLRSLFLVVMLIVMAVWTLLAWGMSELVSALPALLASAQNVTQQKIPLLDLIPKNMSDTLQQTLLLLWQTFSEVLPGLTDWAGYLVWLTWAVGIIFLLIVTCLVGKRREY
ncbi:MAG TPA: hypothetical protein VGI71_04240 [Scandinavium sp.]|jgi:predicted PurR-regulated permease PerM